MDRNRIFGILIVFLVACALAAFAGTSLLAPATPAQKELDFTVSGKNDCLRFLNSSISMVYVPINAAANQHWQLTINSTKMPGGANGWVDLYLYEGYWNGGSNNTCLSGDVYPILSHIQSVDAQIRGNKPYTQTFGGSTPQSYTVFFIFPPNGQATFHVTLKQVT